MPMKPKFDGKDDENGCVGYLLWVGVLVFISSAIVRVIHGGRNRLDLYICYGALILLVIALIVQFRNESRDAKISKVEKQTWKKSSVDQDASIRNRPHDVLRSVPGFAEKQEGWGCWVAAAAFFVMGGLISQSPEYIGLGVFFLILPLLGWAKSRLGKWLWPRSAVVVNTVIMERIHIEDSDPEGYANSYRYVTVRDEEWFLVLDAIPAQLAIDPYARRVQVKVNRSQYAYYAGKTSVTIYYHAAKPFVFLLEDEI